MYFSQLDSVDGEIQTTILNYEVSVDLLVNMDDTEILDVFSRLNSYSATLNEQEKINANHFGEFKMIADKIAFKYNNFWISNKIITEQQILRMNDVQLVADILIAITDEIKEKKQIGKYYDKYEKEFPFSTELIENNFDECIRHIYIIFPDSLKDTEFIRVTLFYSLFISVYHMVFGIKNLDARYRGFDTNSVAKYRNNLEKVEEIFKEEDKTKLSKDQFQFLTDCQRATTDAAVRVRRSNYILDAIMG